MSRARIIGSDKPLEPRAPHDYYPTHPNLVRAILTTVIPPSWKELEVDKILDPGAGNGYWGQLARELWPQSYIVGAELRNLPPVPAYDKYYAGLNFLTDVVYPNYGYDLVIGNPPYSDAEGFVRKGLEYLSRFGLLIYLLPMSFGGSQVRSTGLFEEYPPYSTHVVSKRPGFWWERDPPSYRTDYMEYEVFLWMNGYKGPTTRKWDIRWNWPVRERRGGVR